MQEIIIDKKLTLTYQTFGKGEQYLFCFHGYQLGLDLFDTLKPIWEDKFTVVILSIPSQNGSVILDKSLIKDGISNEDWNTIFSTIETTFLQHRYHLAAFSLGSRIALKWMELKSDSILSVQLFAPDGFYIAPSFYFANKTILGRAIVKANIHFGSAFLYFIQMLSSIGLVQKKYFAFVEQNYKGKKKRFELYVTWSLLMACIFPKKVLWCILERFNQKSIRIYIGKFDTILPLRYYDAFRDHPSLSFKVLNKAHMLLKNPNIIGLIE